MSVIIEKPKTERALLKSAFHAVLACIEAAHVTGPNYHNVALQVRDAVSHAIGKQTKSTGNRAWNWAVKTLIYAIGEVLVQQRELGPLSSKKNEAIDAFMSSATKLQGLEIDNLAFRNPALSPIFDDARKALPALILASTTSIKLNSPNLPERFDKALRSASSRVIAEEPNYYSELELALTSLGGDGARKDLDWAKHHHWISQLHTDAKVFSTDDEEETTVQEVYLRLRCFWNEVEDYQDDEDSPNRKVRNAFIEDLHSEAHKWLKNGQKDDRIRIVTGGPGSGKSSFARSFAHEVILKGTHRVAFIRLQHTRLSGALTEDIARYFSEFDNKTSKTGNPGLSNSPIELRKTDEMPLLLIFDGLDELTTRDDEAKTQATNFLMSLNQMLYPLNHDGSEISALVLGRNISCEAAMKVANMPLRRMLNVASIAPLDAMSCGLKGREEQEGKVHDSSDLVGKDQRIEYWTKWATAKNLTVAAVPAPITDKRMAGLNVEPLLLHLLVISKYCGEEWEDAADNRNLVYEDILKKIYQRNRKKKHFITEAIEEEDYFLLMECLGLAAWSGNGRTGDEARFAKVRKLHIDREKRFKSIPATDLKSVALNLHTRDGGVEGSTGYEFIHKSFGEYLAGRGLFTKALLISKNLVERDPEDFVDQWTELFGAAELTEEIIKFLYDQAKIQSSRAAKLKSLERFGEFFNYLVKVGPPAHRIFPEMVWQECSERARGALAASFAVYSALAFCSHQLDKLKSSEAAKGYFKLPIFREFEPPRSLFENIGVTSENAVNKAMKCLDLENVRFWGLNLSRSDISNSLLVNTEIIHCVCLRTNFASSELMNTAFARVNAADSNFSNCILRGSIFRHCNLTGAVFQNTTLGKGEPYNGNAPIHWIGQKNATAFLNTNLSDVRFISSVFDDVVFADTDLERAEFNDVDFGKTKFKQVKLENCIFKDCDLSQTTGLSLRQLRTAHLEGKTKLPKRFDGKGLDIVK